MAGGDLQDWAARPHVPEGLLLQWHLTERCNLQCAHCYQETSPGLELGWTEWREVLRQFEDLLSSWQAQPGVHAPRGHITVTGGEPFLAPDCPALLERLASARPRYSFALLTNGSLIDAALAHRLARWQPSFVQVSLEGTEITHDRIRGPGEFARAVAAIERLRRARVRTFISFTAHRANYREFPDVARLGRRLRVARVWADRWVPAGKGRHSGLEALNPSETREFLALMGQARCEGQRAWRGRTEVSMHRALQFLMTGARPYRCTAGDSLLTVLPNGDLAPCRRMPIRVGNLLATPLAQLYATSELLAALRDPRRVSRGCEGCAFKWTCRGGLRCLAYALSGDPFHADPGCWLAAPRDITRRCVA